jgi:hypothetical protein
MVDTFGGLVTGWFDDEATFDEGAYQFTQDKGRASECLCLDAERLVLLRQEPQVQN